MKRIRNPLGPAAGAVAGMLCAATVAAAVEVQWDFDNAALTPSHNDHTTTMQYFNDDYTGSAVSFGTASSYGLPALPGGDANAMFFPAFDEGQGLILYDLGPANGGGAYINQYTMGWDILIPDTAANWQPLYNTTALNGNDADFYIRPSGDGGGIGISNTYEGTINANQWHRIVVAVDLTQTKMDKYIDGVLVGSQTISGVDGRWALYTDDEMFIPPQHDMSLLTEGDASGQYTNAGYLSSFYYTDKYVDAATVAAWGAADADGIFGSSPPGPMPDLNMDGKVDIFDVAIVSNNWANTGTPGTVTGDANKDGVVDIFDVALISNNWNPGGDVNAAAVPEPSSLGLLCLAAIALISARHSYRRR